MTARSYRTSSGGESPRRKQNSVARQRAGATDTTTGGKRPRWDSNPRITDLQSVPLDHLGTRPSFSQNIRGFAVRQVGERTDGTRGVKRRGNRDVFESSGPIDAHDIRAVTRRYATRRDRALVLPVVCAAATFCTDFSSGSVSPRRDRGRRFPTQRRTDLRQRVEHLPQLGVTVPVRDVLR